MIKKDLLKKALLILCFSIFQVDISQSVEIEKNFNSPCVEHYNAVFSSN